MNGIRVLVLLVAAACVSATTFEDCGSVATINRFSISGCEAPPCTFTRGGNITIEFDMVSTGEAASMHDEFLAVIDGSLTVLYKTPACMSLTSGNCPVTFGEVLKYSKTLTIDAAWRPMTTDFIYMVEADHSGKDGIIFACASLPVVFV